MRSAIHTLCHLTNTKPGPIAHQNQTLGQCCWAQMWHKQQAQEQQKSYDTRPVAGGDHLHGFAD